MAMDQTTGNKKPGQKSPGKPGRPPGTPNRATVEFRQTIQKLLDANQANVGKWLAAVAKEDPAKALDLLAKLAEFAAPKLGRTEHTGLDGSALVVQVVKFADAPVEASE